MIVRTAARITCHRTIAKMLRRATTRTQEIVKRDNQHRLPRMTTGSFLRTFIELFADWRCVAHDAQEEAQSFTCTLRLHTA